MPFCSSAPRRNKTRRSGNKSTNWKPVSFISLPFVPSPTDRGKWVTGGQK